MIDKSSDHPCATLVYTARNLIFIRKNQSVTHLYNVSLDHSVSNTGTARTVAASTHSTGHQKGVTGLGVYLGVFTQ